LYAIRRLRGSELPAHVAGLISAMHPVAFVANDQAAISAIELPSVVPFIDIKYCRSSATATSRVSAPRFRTRISCGPVFPFLAEKLDEMLAAGAEVFSG